MLCPLAPGPTPSVTALQEGRTLLVRPGGLHYRALAVEHEGEVLWFWIGSHADYDKLLGHM
jgi:hypothetical protein